MVLNCNENIIKIKFFDFFQYIFNYGVISIGLKISLIRPIINDKFFPINELNYLRPISISNTLAQIFERILFYNLEILKVTHQNQFVYKN
jgi:hypothetical protein